MDNGFSYEPNFQTPRFMQIHSSTSVRRNTALP